MCTVLILALRQGDRFQKSLPLSILGLNIVHCMSKLEGVGISLLVGIWCIGISISLYSLYLHLVVIKRHTIIKIIRYINNTYSGPLSASSNNKRAQEK